MKKIQAILTSSLLAAGTAFSASLPNAASLATEMKLGWNIGNTMEVTRSDGEADETYWGNPQITQTLIDSVKAAGFNVIRIPCAWSEHADASTYVISSTWMARVKEVVDYCIKDSMFVILNAHWDNGWLQDSIGTSVNSTITARQKSYWTQIATEFKDYDRHLLFAGANEPAVTTSAQMTVLLSYYQTFVDAVRAVGGNNATRTLIVQGPVTDIEKTYNLMNTLPTDTQTGYMMVEIHDYTPYQFTMMTADASWGNQFYYWGTGLHSSTDTDHNPTWGEETYIDSLFNLMKTKFVSKGYPVVIGEFGASIRTNLSGSVFTLHLTSVAHFDGYAARSGLARGLIPVYWDNGVYSTSSQGDNYKIIDRSNGAVTQQQIVDSLLAGAGLYKGWNASTSTTASRAPAEASAIQVSAKTSAGTILLNIGNVSSAHAVTLYNLSGKALRHFSGTQIQSEMAFGKDLPQGMYILRIRTDSGNTSLNIIK